MIGDKLLYSVPDAARILGVGRSTVYNLISDGVLVRRKIRGRAAITRDSILAVVSGSVGGG